MRDRAVLVLHGRLIDGTGVPPIEDGAVLVEGGRVSRVGKATDIAEPADALVIDASGKSVLPGIIEGHAHVGGIPRSQKILRLSLQRGITTVCDVNANLRGIELRNGIAEGSIRGCSRVIAGCMVTPTNGHVKFRTADGPWEVRKAVREMVMAGADFIKTAASGGFAGEHETCAMRNYTLEELEALTDEAHAWFRPVVVHCHTQPGLDNCIRAGVDQIHHGAYIDAAAVRGIAEKGLYYMPTLAVTCERNIQGRGIDSPWETEEMKESQPIHRSGVRLAVELGVKLCVGCDYPGTPRAWRIGERTMYEMMELERCGLSRMAAIVAATKTNAEAYGKGAEIGTLEPGKRADLIVVSGNPLEDLGVLYREDRIALVMKDGVVESVNDENARYFTIREEQPEDRQNVPF